MLFVALVILFCLELVTSVGHVRLTSVSESTFNQYLYLRLKNENPPSTTDPALADAQVRKQSCADIVGSGLFETYYHLHPLDEKKLYMELKNPRLVHIFLQLYSPRKNRIKRLLSRRRKYTNEFTQQRFTVNNSVVIHDPYEANEYVFMCLLKDLYSEHIQLFYVSKEYNLNERNNGEPFKSGRFVFERRRDTPFTHARLAEESAQNYTPVRPDFNIELYYLGIRSHRQPAEKPDDDPICLLVPYERQNNQNSRLCTAVLTSTFLKNNFRYPMQLNITGCERKRVSFLTVDAVQKSAGEIYYEHVVSCMAVANSFGFIKTYYVSRAYTTNQVFVYESDVMDEDIMYLKSLCINLNFVLERTAFNFDDVE